LTPTGVNFFDDMGAEVAEARRMVDAAADSDPAVGLAAAARRDWLVAAEDNLATRGPAHY
jgi:hypothetical protein